MLWFILSRTAALVWEEWGRNEKKKKTFALFWAATIVYLIGLAVFFAKGSLFSGLDRANLSGLVSAAQRAVIVLFVGPFMFAGAVLTVYFFVNVLWCAVFPLAGIHHLLDEEDKASGGIIIPFDVGGDE